MAIFSSSVHLLHCSFSNNSVGVKGGAILIGMTVRVEINHCLFENNTSAVGGAIVCDMGGKNVVVHNCTFKANAATGFAGAMYINGTSMTISNSDFLENASPVGGAIHIEGKHTIHITQSNFSKTNYGTNYVQQSSLGSAIVAYSATIILKRVQFLDNKVGGALILKQGKGEIHSCLFGNNQGNNAGAIFISTHSTLLLITRTTFFGNQGPLGTDMYLSNKLTLIQNCTFLEGNVSALSQICIAMIHADVVDIKTYDTVFVRNKTHQMVHSMFYIVRPSPRTVSLTFEVWRTMYNTTSNSSFLVDQNVINNSSYSFVYVEGNVNLTTEVSQFASCKLACYSPSALHREQQTTLVACIPVKIHLVVVLISVFPLPCLDGCHCFYSVDTAANTVNCSNNNLTSLPAEILPRTDHLIMTGNNLQFLSINDVPSEITNLNLQRCNIRQISEGTLKMLVMNRSAVRLNDNKMSRISTLLQTLEFQAKLWLGNNPYECNCDMMWMSNWLQNATNVMDKENTTCSGGKWNGKCSTKM